MKYGSLFSGAGLGDFGFEMAGLEVAWQVEINEYARKILDLRWPNVKKYTDIREIKPEELEKVDLIAGGFPCQPFSVAGKQMGQADDRNLWPEMLRIIKTIKPRWVVAENVPGIIPIYLDTVLTDLGSEGYTCWPVVFSSHSLGAHHKRERIWIMAYRDSSSGSAELGEQQDQRTKEFDTSSEGNVDNSLRRRHDASQEQVRTGRDSFIYSSWWAIEPAVGRVAHGITRRVDRLKCLGNGQTPCSTYVIGKWIMQYENR